MTEPRDPAPSRVKGDDGKWHERGCPFVADDESDEALHDCGVCVCRPQSSAGETPRDPAPPEHVCGLTGYNGMIDPPCPACVARAGETPATNPESTGWADREADRIRKLQWGAGETPEASEKRAFMAGWRHGYYDHGEHDCRMFTPTAERAWEDYKRKV